MPFRTLTWMLRTVAAVTALSLTLSSFVPAGIVLAIQDQVQQTQALEIGVLDLTATGISTDDAMTISNRFRLYLGRQPVFKPLERAKMIDIMNELEFGFTGACNDDECVVQVGKLLQVRKMIAGSVGKVGSIYTIQARLIDVETGVIQWEDFSNVTGLEAVLDEATQEVAQKLARRAAEIMLREGSQAQAAVEQMVQQQEDPPVREQTPPAGGERAVPQQGQPAGPEDPSMSGQPDRKGGLLIFFLLAVLGYAGYRFFKSFQGKTDDSTPPPAEPDSHLQLVPGTG